MTDKNLIMDFVLTALAQFVLLCGIDVTEFSQGQSKVLFEKTSSDLIFNFKKSIFSASKI